MNINGRTVKFVIQKDWNKNADYEKAAEKDIHYCSVDELEDLYKSIDSDDVIHWCPIGSLAFHRKFRKIFRGEDYEETDI